MDKQLRKTFDEINDALLTYEKPSDYFKENINEKNFEEYPFSQIKKLKEIEQNRKYHKEGNVFNHTMLTIDVGAKLLDDIEDKEVFMWGLLLHDLGKITTTKMRRGQLTSYDHDIEGERLSIKFLQQFDFLEEDFIKEVSKIVRWHMQVLFIAKDMKHLSQIDELKKDIDANLIAKVAYCDRMGRLDVDEKEVNEKIEMFLKVANKSK